MARLKELLEMENRFTNLDKRVTVIEALNKRGNLSIHPLWIAIVILLVLF